MNNNSDAIKVMVESIINTVHKVVHKAPFDKTARGIVVAVPQAGYYSVEVFGSRYDIKSSAVHQINEAVWVVVPQNNWKNIFILGENNGSSSGVGKPGADGKAATVQVGTVSTLAAGSQATVTNSGTNNAAVLNFGIPKGDKGNKGDTGATGKSAYEIAVQNGYSGTVESWIASLKGVKGDKGDTGLKGDTGKAATIRIGTVKTLSAGSQATVTNVGTENDAVLDISIPKGDKGDTGATGAAQGTLNYNELNNRPSINGEELTGNKTSIDLGLLSSAGGVVNGDLYRIAFGTNNTSKIGAQHDTNRQIYFYANSTARGISTRTDSDYKTIITMNDDGYITYAGGHISDLTVGKTPTADADAATKKYVDDIVKQTLLAAHPVGSYYWSSEATEPSTLFGGTWERVKDKFVYAAGGKTVGATGGSERVSITTAQLPWHTHTQRAMQQQTTQYPFEPTQDWYSYVKEGYWAQKRLTDSVVLTNGNTGGVGNGESHENMPPYIVAYCWRRTA